MRPRAIIAWARLRRWFYLITTGMWKGEQAVDFSIGATVLELSVERSFTSVHGVRITQTVKTFYSESSGQYHCKQMPKR